MKTIVAEFQKYIETYDKQFGYENYTDDNFIKDVIYGIGHSISIAENNKEYRFVDGFKKFFKERI